MKSPRHQIPSHFTASGIVIEQGHMLLVNHRRIGAWVPPGGHIEADELPEECAAREILEETGVEVEIISRPSPQNDDDADAFFLAQPFFMQAVLAVEGGERFYHVDLAYLCRVKHSSAGSLPPLSNNPEVKESRWIRLTELNSVPLAKNVLEILDLLDDQIYEIRDTERDFSVKAGIKNKNPQ